MLLRRYVETTAWQLEVVPWGHSSPELDHEMTVPRWSGAQPQAVIVHSPAAYLQAQEQFAGTPIRIVWMLHSAHPDIKPRPEPTEILVCTNELAEEWRLRYPNAVVHAITPWYKPELKWSWRQDYTFSMLNFPASRVGDRERMTADVMRYAQAMRQSVMWHQFGADRPDGYLEGEKRDSVIASCSAYVDVVPYYGGFGLAHHEMLAAGVPIVARLWGQLTRERLPVLPSAGCGNDELAKLVIELCTDRVLAKEHSRSGLDYISEHCRRETMERQIRAFLEHRP